MIISLQYLKFKEKVSTLFVIIALLFGGVYFYLHHMQQSYNNAQWSGERCLSELTSIKYQLKVVTEYKDHIDKLLTETQKVHEADKDKYKDIVDSCLAMKQQTAICQNQFEDLQIECKKVREDFDKITKEVGRVKPTG